MSVNMNRNNDAGWGKDYLNTADMLSSRPPQRFMDVQHYKRVLESRLLRARIPVERLDRIEAGPVGMGIIPRSNLFTIRLYDADNRNFARLFAKTIHEGMRGFSISPPLVTLSETSAYQATQIGMWTQLGLPAPLFIDYVEEERRIGSGRRKIEGLLMEELIAPPHNLDLIAIKKKKEMHERSLEDKFISNDQKGVVRRRLRDLEELRTKILLSGLQVIYDFAIFGSKIDPHTVKIPKHPERHYFGKLKHYLENVFLWHKLDSDEIKIDELRTRGTKARVFGELGSAIQQLRKYSLDTLVKAIKENAVYRQGDEFPYHMAFHRVHNDPLKPGEDIIRSVIIDADHATVCSLADAQAKWLFNHVSDVDCKEASKLIVEANEYGKRRLRMGLDAKLVNEDLNLDLDSNKIRKQLDFAAIFELLCTMGRRSADALINKSFHDEHFLAGIQYNNPFIDEECALPNYINLAHAYEVGASMEKLKKPLRELFEKIREKGADYEVDEDEERAIIKLEELVKRFGIL